MAVIGTVASFTDVADFLRGLKSGTASLVQQITDRSRTCGFFIAPDMILLPSFGLPPDWAEQPVGSLRFRQGSKLWRASSRPEILGDPASGEGTSIALVKVTQRREGKQGLPFALEPPPPGDQVVVLHHPHGQSEAAVSFGRALSTPNPGWVAYDADTVPGSSGAPVFDSHWQVVAMHMRAAGDRNEGLSRAAIVDLLRQSRYWPKLAKQHGFAEIPTEPAAPVSPPSPDDDHLAPLRRAALSPVIRPRSLSAAERDMLREMVGNPDSDQWVLPVSARRAIIDAAGSLAALRRHRRRSKHPAEKVIDRVFKGPPYDLDGASEEELGWWAPVARWFEGIVSDLPTPVELQSRLERLRLRNRLETIVGSDFQGRDQELDQLATWYQKGGPIVVTGVGGVGKSALLAKFAQELAPDTLLLWLDFDRADLAPDDARSVLQILADQLRVQTRTGGPLPKIAADDWQDAARRIGADIAAAGGGDPVLILDSFEAAQYSDRYQEVWPVLEVITRAAPRLRVCVTGRAEVPELSLNGRAAETLALRGLPRAAAARWLRKHKIADPKVLEPVLRIAQGIPLILHLALRYLETGGNMRDLPQDLPDKVIAGYLYRRILNRVHDPAIHPLASGVLILRRFSEDMLRPVFEGLVDLPSGEPAEWCRELRREKSLLDASGDLRLRSEVRAATLELLEREKPDLVDKVDVRAAQWYASKTELTVEDSAELVYHSLRRDDLAGAGSAWRDGCGALLTYAGEEMRSEAARDWLEAQLGAGGGASLRDWEYDALMRVIEARQRGNHAAVAGILAERPDRSADSPLAFQDGYELWRSDQRMAAKSVLSRRQETMPGDPRCAVLLALIAWSLGDRGHAERLLAALDKDMWFNYADSEDADMAVQAARIRLTIDFQRELRLIEADPPNYVGLLVPADVLLPRLSRLFRPDFALLESIGPEFDAAHSSTGQLAEVLRANIWERKDWLRAHQQELVNAWDDGMPLDTPAPEPRLLARTLDAAEAEAIGVAELSWRRWWLAQSQDFMSRAAKRLFVLGQLNWRWPDGIVATMLLLMTRLEHVDARIDGVPIERVLLSSPWSGGTIEVGAASWELIRDLLRVGVSDLIPMTQPERGDAVEVNLRELLSVAQLPQGEQIQAAGLAYFLIAEDPLEGLVHRLARLSMLE